MKVVLRKVVLTKVVLMKVVLTKVVLTKAVHMKVERTKFVLCKRKIKQIGKKCYLLFFGWIQDSGSVMRKKSNPVFRINIPDPQH